MNKPDPASPNDQPQQPDDRHRPQESGRQGGGSNYGHARREPPAGSGHGTDTPASVPARSDTSSGMGASPGATGSSVSDGSSGPGGPADARAHAQDRGAGPSSASKASGASKKA